MAKTQTIIQVKRYFNDHRPLGSSVVLKKIHYLGGGNHFNYLIETNKGNFVMRISNPQGLGVGVLFDIPDEFTLLKQVEPYNVAPKAITIDLEGFSSPLLIEEYIKGISYGSLKKVSADKLTEVIKLMLKISEIRLDFSKFPFRFSYTQYKTNVRGWEVRIKEVEKLGNQKRQIKVSVKEFRKIARQASRILERNQPILSAVKPTFIYNDVHKDNLFWLPRERRALFIDWQKVSLGDPAFMPAVFALAFEGRSGTTREKFFSWVVKNYNSRKKIRNFEDLFYLRILEREIANMIWVVWASLKQGKGLPYKNLSEYERYKRVQGLLAETR